MAINKAGSGSSNNVAQPKPKEPPKVEKAPQGQSQQTGTRNTVRTAARPPSDGFETRTSGQRSQQQALLGSTAAAAPVAPPRQSALEKLGLTPQDLIQAGSTAAPHLERAAQAAAQGNWSEALGHLGDAASSSPEIAAKAVNGLAQNLPAGVAKTLLTNDAVIQELLTNKELHASIGKLIQNPTDLSAVRELIGNDSLRDTVLGALGTDPAIRAQLEQIGLTPEDLVQAGQAAPKLIDAFEKLRAGDVKGALADFQAAVEAAPELAAKLGQQLLDRVPPQIREQLAKLGITAETLQTAGAALPHLYDAADAVVKGDWQRAFDSLKQAAGAAPEVVQQAIKGLANQLPPELGAVKSLLTDDAFVRELVTNTELRDQVGKLFNDSTRMEGLRELLGNDSARDATLSALGNDPAIKAQLEQIGLTPEDLVQAGRAAPKLWDAFEKLQAGDVKGGLTDFQAAVEAAPELAAKLGERLVEKLPASVKEQFARLGITEEALRDAGPALPHLYDAVQAVANGDWQGALNAVREAGIAAPQLATQALKGLASQLPAELGAIKTLLTNDAFLTQLVTNTDLHDQVGKLFNESTRMEGLRALLGNDSARDAALAAIGSDPGVQATLARVGLTPADLVEAGAAAPHLMDAMQAFTDGRIEDGAAALGRAAEAAPTLLDKMGQKVLERLPANVRDAINSLGLTASELTQAAQALPELIRAGQALIANDPQAALRSLKNAAGKIPSSIVEKAIVGMASKLPETGFAGMARSLLTNPDFVKELVNNQELHASFDKMMQGDFVTGLREILGNPAVRDTAANALASNPEIMDKLRQFGIQSGADISALGGSVFDVLDAVGHLAATPPNPQEALKSLSKAVANLTPDLRARMVGAFADKLGLPAWAKDTLVAAAGLIGNEAVGQSLGQAFDALKRGDVAGFAAGLAATGRTIAQTSPEVAKAFLNSLARIPGSVGELFADPQLNAAMVDSGAAANMFNAFEKLASGDIGGALNEIASAAGSLLGHGEHFEVAGVELPFGQQGIENFTRLFGRFIDALPDSIKAKITEAATKFAAKAGLKSVPFLGNIISGFSSLGSLKDLVGALREEPKDPVKIALAAGQLGLDVAGVIPGLNSLTGPLQAVLGTATVIKGAADLIGDLREFQRGLLGM
jgi:hypothetical protein